MRPITWTFRRGGEPSSHRLSFETALPLSDSGFQVDPVGNLGKYCIGVFFFGFDRLKESSILIQAQNLGLSPKISIHLSGVASEVCVKGRFQVKQPLRDRGFAVNALL
jgi:hypothetical protein